MMVSRIVAGTYFSVPRRAWAPGLKTILSDLEELADQFRAVHRAFGRRK